MDLSTAHEAARLEACRLPALQASLALLVEDTRRAAVAFYGTVRPAPGADPGGAAVVTVQLDASPGSINTTLKQIELTVPVEGQVTGADPTTGTEVLWARITDGTGSWWADCSVSDQAGGGEFKLASTTLQNGAFLRVSSAVFQG